MTKTITEQWREGMLKEGFYYILFASRFGKDYIAIDMFIPDEKDFMYSSCEDVKEVLAPVPSYDEWKELDDELKKLATKNDTLAMGNGRLKEKLAISTKALKEYSVSDNWFMEDSEGKCWSFNKQYPWRIGFKALKEMEGV